MEIRRTVVAFDHGDRPARPDDKRAEGRKRTPGIGKMFQHEADKNVVETLWAKREAEEITGTERHVFDPFGPHAFLRTPEGFR